MTPQEILKAELTPLKEGDYAYWEYIDWYGNLSDGQFETSESAAKCADEKLINEVEENGVQYMFSDSEDREITLVRIGYGDTEYVIERKNSLRR